jgi:hypothetical protein
VYDKPSSGDGSDAEREERMIYEREERAESRQNREQIGNNQNVGWGKGEVA